MVNFPPVDSDCSDRVAQASLSLALSPRRREKRTHGSHVHRVTTGWHVTNFGLMDHWSPIGALLEPYWMLLDCLPSLPWCICHHLPATNSLGLSYAAGGPEEHSPLQVPPGMESPVASQSGLPSDFGIDPLIERMNTSDAVALYRHHWECEKTFTVMSFQFTRLWHQSNVMFYPKHWKTLFERVIMLSWSRDQTARAPGHLIQKQAWAIARSWSGCDVHACCLYAASHIEKGKRKNTDIVFHISFARAIPHATTGQM